MAHQSASYGSLITKAQWSHDSRSILALVERPNGDRHIVQSYLIGGRSSDMTPGNINITTFSEAGGTIAYLVAEKKSPPNVIGKPITDGSSDLTGISLFHIFFPTRFPDASSLLPSLDLWVRYKGVSRQVNANDTWHFPNSADGLRIAVSPNGKSLIAAGPVPTVPTSWSSYNIVDTTSSFASAHTGTDRSGKSFNWPWRYIYVDLDKMTIKPLVDAPSGFLEGYIDALQAAWSADSQEVLFTNSYLPLSDHSVAKSTERAAACAAAVYTVATKGVSCVAYARFPKENVSLRSGTFGVSRDQVKLHWSGSGKTQTNIYERLPLGWVLSQQQSTPEEQPSTLTIFVRQDINEPPILWAADSNVGVAKPLWNPNPQLASLDLGHASIYTWKDVTGYEWRGELILPQNFIQGHRCPLVIQTHGVPNEHEFMVDGSFTTGFAARALAAAGLAVLQVEDRADRYTKPAQQEALLAVYGFKSAIEQLSQEGVVDSSNVGIIGFSRTAWYVEEALVREPHLFHAATLIDGVDQSYMTYMLLGPGSSETAIEGEAANGAKPFGPGLERWVANASTFNLYKIDIPVRIEAIGTASVLQEWEIYSSLYQQGKPVDFVYLPRGQHILQSPQSRYASQQGNLDWFRFWLQGYVDQSSNNSTQFDRWKNLCSKLSDSNARTAAEK